MTSTESTMIHGVMMRVFDYGVLFTGESGIGKSEVALALIHHGHQLIADDIVEVSKSNQHLIGASPTSLRNFLEVRGIGVLNIQAMFGDLAVGEACPIKLIIHLEPMEQIDKRKMDRLHGMHLSQEILGITVPQITIPVASGRNMAVLTECAIRNEILKLEGYDAAEDFRQQLRDRIQSSENSNDS